jgi:hypothetical protein
MDANRLKRNIMKKLIIALALLILAAPAIADTWTFTWDTQTGDLDHLVMYHKDATGFTGTAQEFIDAGGFTEITLGNTSPQEFTVDYADGTVYGVYCAAFDAEGNNTIHMDSDRSPTVWRMTAIPSTSDAHWEDVVPVVNGEITVNVTVTVGR